MCLCVTVLNLDPECPLTSSCSSTVLISVNSHFYFYSFALRPFHVVACNYFTFGIHQFYFCKSRPELLINYREEIQVGEIQFAIYSLMWVNKMGVNVTWGL